MQEQIRSKDSLAVVRAKLTAAVTSLLK